MPQLPNTLSLEVTKDHAIRVEPAVGGTVTVTNLNGDTLYYSDNAQVSAASNQGTLTAGNAQTFLNTVWLRSASLSTVTAMIIPPVSPTGIVPVVNVQDAAYGARADAVQVAGGAITSGQNALSVLGGFQATDVGKFVMVPGAGPSGAGAPGPFTAYIGGVSTGVASLVTTKGGATPANASNTVSTATVTYGTGCASAVNAAIASGSHVHIPAGSYVWDSGLTPTKAPYVTGDTVGRTIIYFPSNIAVLTYTPTGAGLTGATAALTANAVMGAQSLAVTAVPAGLSPGDFLYLSSTTVFDATETFCTLGEFCRVYGISGTTIYLNSPLTGPFTYTTGASAQIQKVTFGTGVHFEGIEWVNGTPEQLTSGPATPATTVVNAGNGNVLQIKRCLFPTLKNMKVTGWSGDFIGFTNCLHFRGENIDAKDGAQVPNAPSGNSYGYTISAYGSMWGEIKSGSIEMCHGYFNAEGTGQVAGDIVMPTSQVEVRDAVSRNGIGEPFLCHNASAFVDFIGCKVIGGPLFPTENTHNSGFQIVGKYCRVIDPIISNASGRPVALLNDHCEVICPVIRSLAPWNDRCDAITVGGTNCRVVSADIDGVPNPPSGTGGRGVWVQSGATGFQMSGRSTIRNTGSDGVFIADTSNTESIDGLLGIGNGRYVIETLGTSPQGLWSNVRGIGFTTGLTNAPSGLAPNVANYQLFTAGGTFTVPVGVTKLRIRAVGAGGGGGGGGSATTGIAQTGGGGGSGGSITEVEGFVAAGDTITIAVGAAGTSGGGGAANGNPGVAGGLGGISTAIDTTQGTTLAKARGGAGGAASAASSTTVVGGGLFGTATTQTGGSSLPPGSGAPSGATTNNPIVCVVGGSGGAASSATNGGNGGSAQLSSVALDQQAAGSGTTGSTAGGAGVTATQPGCGGGGGGGGTNATGAGGNGGVGGGGLVELWW